MLVMKAILDMNAWASGSCENENLEIPLSFHSFRSISKLVDELWNERMLFLFCHLVWQYAGYRMSSEDDRITYHSLCITHPRRDKKSSQLSFCILRCILRNVTWLRSHNHRQISLPESIFSRKSALYRLVIIVKRWPEFLAVEVFRISILAFVWQVKKFSVSFHATLGNLQKQ